MIKTSVLRQPQGQEGLEGLEGLGGLGGLGLGGLGGLGGVEGSQYITPENIASLEQMGFENNHQMRIALRLSGGNLQHAVEYLLSSSEN